MGSSGTSCWIADSCFSSWTIAAERQSPAPTAHHDRPPTDRRGCCPSRRRADRPASERAGSWHGVFPPKPDELAAVPVWFGHNNAIVVAVAVAATGATIVALNNLDGLQYGISHLPLSASPPALGDTDGSRIVPHDEQLPHATSERVLHPSRPGANECRAQAFLRGMRDGMLEGDVAEVHGFPWTDPISVDGPACEGSVGEGSGG